MKPTVKKRSSYLKALVERRARAAAEEERLLISVQALGRELAAAKRLKLSCDMLIRDYDPTLDGKRIAAVRPPVHFAGRRGELTKAVGAVLDENKGCWLTTMEIAVRVAKRCRIVIRSKEAMHEWSHNSVAKQLKKLMNKGEVERLLDEDAATTWGVSRWRLKSDDGPSLARLRAQAAAAGGSARAPDADHE